MSSHKTYIGKFANFIGGFGYIGAGIQWIWSSIPLIYPLIATDIFQNYVMPATPTQTMTAAAPSFSLSPGVELLLLVFAVIFSVVTIIYAIIAVPKSFGKAGKVVTTKSANVIIPAITHHQKISKKRHRSLLERISWSIKAGLVLIPVFLLLVPTPQEFELTQDQFMAAGIILAIGSALLFAGQFAFAKIARLAPDKVW